MKKGKNITNKDIQIGLLNNFVSLQRVLTNLTSKFDKLSSDISRLLNVYEEAAKVFAEKVQSGNIPNDEKDMLKKLDILLEQNKTVAKGLTLIEEKIRHKVYGENPERTLETKPLPKI